MRINKKERVDVKRYMEEMKANRTNRSYTSIEMRNRQNSQESNFQEKHQASKHSLYGNDNDYSRPRNYAPQGSKYNFDSNMGNMRNVQPIQPIQAIQPIYASYMPPMALNDYNMTQQSQIYASPPSYPQHNGMMNYSQTYNPPVPNYQPVHQDSRYEISYAGESSFGMTPPQASRPSKIQEDARSPKREATFTNFMKNDETTTKKKDQFEEKRAETVEKVEVDCAKKKSLSLEVEKATQAVPVKQKKKRGAYKKRVAKELTQREEVSADEKKKDNEDEKTIDISRKFDEILLLEKKKIEKRLNQDAKLKEILQSFNDKISAVTEGYFSGQVVKNLITFERRMTQFSKDNLESADDRFTEKLLYFESAILRQLIS